MKSMLRLVILAIVLILSLLVKADDSKLDSLAINPNGNSIAIAISNTLCDPQGGYVVNLLSYPNLVPISTIDVGARCQVTGLEWSHDGRYLLIKEEIGSAYVWDTVTQLLVSKTSPFSMGQRFADIFNPSGTLIANTSETRGVILWNPSTGEEVISVFNSQSSVGISWSPNGQYLVTSLFSENGRTCPILETQNFTQVGFLPCDAWSVLWSPDGASIITANSQAFSLWDANTYQLIRQWNKQSGLVDWKWLPDSQHIVASFEEQGIAIWDVTSGLQTFTSNPGVSIRAFDISPIDESIVYLPYDEPISQTGLNLQVIQTSSNPPTPTSVPSPSPTPTPTLPPTAIPTLTPTKTPVPATPTPSKTPTLIPSLTPSYTCTVSGITTEVALKTAITNANGVSTPSVICLQPNSIISVTTLAAPDNSAGDSFLPVIQRDITIVGNGSTLKRATGSPQGRFFRVTGVNAKLTLDGITVTGGIAGGSYYGGAIRVDGRTLILKNNTILTGNTAQVGGAIWNNLGTVQVQNSTLSSNTATQDGGTLYGIGTFTLTNSTVHLNSTMNNGGGLYVYSGSGVVSQVTLTNVNLTNNTVTLNGGGLYFATSGSVTINGSQVKNNSAANYGGGLYLSAGTTTITNTLFEANTTTNSSSLGGAIYDTGATTALNLTDTVFNLNTTRNWGGAIYNDNADLTVMRGAFTNNKVLASGSDGGAIFTINTSASVTIQNTRLVGNTALDQGGAMTLSSGTGSITGSCLSQNSAPNGAAVYSNNAFTATNNWWNNAAPPVNSNVTTNPVTPGATCPLP